MFHARSDYDRIQDPEGKIPDNEPVFLIRGQDIVAPDVLDCWADLHVKRGGSYVIADAVKIHAERMRTWQREQCAKVADVPLLGMLRMMP